MKADFKRTIDPIEKMESVSGIFSIWDLAKFRGHARLVFEKGELGSRDAPILVNYVEIIYFLRDILSGDGIHTLELFSEPVGYAEVISSRVKFTKFDPRQVFNQEILETSDVEDIEREQSKTE